MSELTNRRSWSNFCVKVFLSVQNSARPLVRPGVVFTPLERFSIRTESGVNLQTQLKVFSLCFCDRLQISPSFLVMVFFSAPSEVVLSVLLHPLRVVHFTPFTRWSTLTGPPTPHVPFSTRPTPPLLLSPSSNCFRNTSWGTFPRGEAVCP